MVINSKISPKLKEFKRFNISEIVALSYFPDEIYDRCDITLPFKSGRRVKVYTGPKSRCTELGAILKVDINIPFMKEQELFD